MGTIMKTSGNVHGKTIIERPATYAIIVHVRKEVCSLPSTANSLVTEKIIPTKISENKINETKTIDFFAGI